MRKCGDWYEYLSVWVNDFLILSKDPMRYIEELEKNFTLKGVGQPEYYLGADMAYIKEPEDVFIMGSHTYIQKILGEFEWIVGYKPSNRIKCPLEPGDHLECDNSRFLSHEQKIIY